MSPLRPFDRLSALSNAEGQAQRIAEARGVGMTAPVVAQVVQPGAAALDLLARPRGGVV